MVTSGGFVQEQKIGFDFVQVLFGGKKRWRESREEWRRESSNFCIFVVIIIIWTNSCYGNWQEVTGLVKIGASLIKRVVKCADLGFFESRVEALVIILYCLYSLDSIITNFNLRSFCTIIVVFFAKIWASLIKRVVKCAGLGFVE